MRPFLLGVKMTFEDLYSVVEEVELEQKYIFIVYNYKQIGIDVLDYETEETIDGQMFDTIEEAIEFVKEHEGSL